jgi:hypothetical protein
MNWKICGIDCRLFKGTVQTHKIFVEEIRKTTEYLMICGDSIEIRNQQRYNTSNKSPLVSGPAGSGGQSTVSQRGRPRSNPDQVMWNLRWTNGTGAGFLRVLRFLLPILIPPTAPHSSSSSTNRGWYNKPNSDRRTKWTQSRPIPHQKNYRLYQIAHPVKKTVTLKREYSKRICGGCRWLRIKSKVRLSC